MGKINLRRFRKENGISQQELANYLGIGQGYVSQMERGDRPTPSYVEEKLLANPEWIVAMDDDQEQLTVADKERLLPLIPFDAVAGQGSPVFEEAVEDYYNIREFRSADFLIRVKGDSMIPKYNGGDLVACKRVDDVLFFQWGRVYVIYTLSQGVMIKKIEQADDDSFITCISENPRYGQFNVPKSDIVAIALVVGSISLE